jgi:uncharacterized membrane protein
MLTAIADYVRENLHLMLVHFPIALLFTGIVLDWAGYWLGRMVATRFGFYILALGTLGAIASALSGPDPDPDTSRVLFAWHTLFALATVTLALALIAVRFIATDGLHGRAAQGYLGATLALMASVCATGFFGGRMLDDADAAALLAPPLLPAKALIILLCLLGGAALALWLYAGRRFAPLYFAPWRQAARHALHERGALWTLRRAAQGAMLPRMTPAARSGRDTDRYSSATAGR